MNSKHMKNPDTKRSSNTNKKTTVQRKNTKNNGNKSNVSTKKSPKNKKGSKVLKRIILITLSLLVIVSGVFAYQVVRNGGGLKGILTTVTTGSEKKELSEIQVLIMGESLNLTDSIMIGSYNPNTQKASMLSIPRDTFVGSNPKRATASDKINSLYQGKYPEKTLKAVNELTGLNLQYYVVVDTDALTEIVNTIGGVEFNVPIDMDYDDTSKENYLRIHLKKGLQTINGEQAEQLLRFRHNNDGSTYPAEYGEQDIGRMRTQREFIAAAMKQTLTPANLFKIGDFIDIANRNIKTNIPISLLKDYIPYAVEFNTENIQTGTLPGEAVKLNGVWLFQMNDTEAQVLINQLYFNGPTEEQISEDSIRVQVLNGSGDATKLIKAVNTLKESGFTIVQVGNTTSTKKTSITNRSKQPAEISTKIKEKLNIGTISNGKKSGDIDFTVILGKDY